MAFMTFDGGELQTDNHFLSLDSYACSLTLSHKRTDSDVQTFLEGEENQKSKTKSRKFQRHFSRLGTKIDNRKICHRSILAIYLNYFFYREGPSQ